MHVAHRARDLALRNVENLRVLRRVEIAVRAGLNLRVAALLDERRQPADLELAPDDDQQVGFLELEDEARLRFDEVRILIALRERIDGDPIAAHLLRDRRQILGRGDDVELSLRARVGDADERDDQPDECRCVS